MLQRTDTITSVACLLALALPATSRAQEPAAADSTAAEAKGPVPAHVHVRHVAYRFRGTPDERGLLPAAVAEAEIAHRHAALAAGDLTDVESVTTHVRHVVHALDPSAAGGGPGLGYGVVKAAERVAHYSELATRSIGASDGIVTHAPHVIEASRNAEANAEIALDVAQRILERTGGELSAADTVTATDAGEDTSTPGGRDAGQAEGTSPEEPLEELVARLEALTRAILNGADLDGDGQVVWSGGEGGLEQAESHLDLLIRSEGIAR